MKSPPQLILASSSRYRADLLSRLRLPFDAVAPGIEEAPLANEAPAATAARLARSKAGVVARRHPTAWVIGSDQLAVRERDHLGKPGSAARSVEELLACSGKVVAFFTAIAVVKHESSSLHEFADTTTVHFRRLDRERIEQYVAREPAADCAGGFKSEGLGITLFESIESSDPTALVGLPLIGLSAILRRIGYDLP